MTIFGFFATIVICITLVAIVLLLHKYPITILTRKHVTVKQDELDKVITEKPDNTEIEKALNQHYQTRKDQGMDALISAANALMGIQTTEEDVTDGKA